MVLQTLTRQIESIPWAEFEQPEWNETKTIADALICASTASDAKSCTSAYDRILYALGNNHAGTYYPVLLPALPIFESLIGSNEQWPQRVALCLLDDLFASFQPEPGYETVLFNGEKQDLATSVKLGIGALLPLLTSVANGGGPNAVLASDLVSLVSGNENDIE